MPPSKNHLWHFSISEWINLRKSYFFLYIILRRIIALPRASLFLTKRITGYVAGKEAYIPSLLRLSIYPILSSVTLVLRPSEQETRRIGPAKSPIPSNLVYLSYPPEFTTSFRYITREVKRSLTHRKCNNLSFSSGDQSSQSLAKNISDNVCRLASPSLLGTSDTIAVAPTGSIFSSTSTLDNSNISFPGWRTSY